MKYNMRVYFQPAFLICVAILATAAGSMSIAIKSFGVYLKKEPAPLKKPLDLLDQNDLIPYKVVSKLNIENQQIVKELGTEDYIQWVLEDTELPPNSTVRKLMLFITYYEHPDRVPHVPEECYTGGGFEKIASDSITFEINNNAGFSKNIDGKYLVFGKTDSDSWLSTAKFPVLYFFRVNGEYAGSREQARIALNKNLFGKSSYFSKVELAFNQSATGVSMQEAIIESQKLLGVILPILEDRHWPDLGKGIGGEQNRNR